MVIQKLFLFFFVSLIHQSNFTRDRSRSAFFRRQINPINLITRFSLVRNFPPATRSLSNRKDLYFICFPSSCRGKFGRKLLSILCCCCVPIHRENNWKLFLRRTRAISDFFNLSVDSTRTTFRSAPESEVSTASRTTTGKLSQHVTCRYKKSYEFKVLTSLEFFSSQLFCVFFSLCFCSSQLEKI